MSIKQIISREFLSKYTSYLKQFIQGKLDTYVTKSELATKANDSDVVHARGDETIDGTKAFSSQIKGNISGSSTSCTGNSASATKLATARTINVTDASGTNTGTAVTFNGTANGVIKLPATIKGALTGNADTATKATNDSLGNKIDTTYIKGLSVSGRTITYTKGDDTTGTITTQDTNTTYPLVSTEVNGLMSATDKAKLDGIAAGANHYTHPSSHPASMITGLAKVATSGSYNDLVNKPAIPAAYSLPDATATVKGGVKIGGNITVASGTISLTKANVVSALGYTPPTHDTNTTYALMSATEATTGTATEARTISAKVLHDKINSTVINKTLKLNFNARIETSINLTKISIHNGKTGTYTIPTTGVVYIQMSLNANTNGARSGVAVIYNGATEDQRLQLFGPNESDPSWLNAVVSVGDKVFFSTYNGATTGSEINTSANIRFIPFGV